MLKRLIAGTLSAIISTTAVLPNHLSNVVIHEAKAASQNEDSFSSKYDINSTNLVGNPFDQEILFEDTGALNKERVINPDENETVTDVVVTQTVTTQQTFVTQTLPALSFTTNEIISETGSLGENISYTLYSDGYLYVSGYGDMNDFGSSPFRDPSLIKYAVIESTGDEKSGEIITSIGNNTFINCSNMESINLPQTIKRIGKNAFRNCSSLSTISYDEYDNANYPEGKLVMPEAVTSVEEYAFANCASITDIDISGNVSEIKDYAFSDCTSLKKVVIGEGTESIGYHIFSGCSAVEDITIPYMGHSLAEVNEEGSKQEFSDFFLNGNGEDYYEIYNAGNWRRYIPKSLKSITVTGGTRIPNYAFYRIPGVKNITVPSMIKSFGAYSYADCVALENANVPEGAESIGNYAFSNCSSSDFKTVKLPSTLASIGSYVFNGCKGLTNITIPKSVKTIGEYTFNNCSALNTVVIYGGADGIGNHIFNGCKSLADLTLPFAGLNEKTIDDPDTRNELSVLFLNGDDKDYYEIYNSGNWRRYIPKSLKKITVLSGTRLSDFAFYRFTGVESFVLPNSMTEIGNYAFAGCSSITKNNIPEGVKYIGDHAFENCTSLSDGKIPEGVISLGKYAFSNCSSASLKTITFPKTLTTVGDYAFSGCSGLTSATVPKTVKTIGAYTFSDCSSLASAVIKGGADGIGSHVFSGCKSLAELTLPFAGYSLEAANADGSKQELLDLFLNGDAEDYYEIYNTGNWRRYIPKALKKVIITGGTRIPNYYFFRLNGVESITIPDSITEIGNYAFAECSSMKTANIPEGVEKIGDSAFRNCSCPDLDTIKLPTALTNIGPNAFTGCTGLTSIVIPDNVKVIGNYAFNDCSALETAVIEGGSESIGAHIFSGCKSLAELTVPFAGFSADSTDTVSEISTYFLNGNEEDYYEIYNAGNWRRYIPKSLKKVTVLGGTRIPDCTFYRLVGVESIVLPDTITEIGSYAYADCSSITDPCLPEGVLSIGNYAFSNSAFKTIKLPSTLASIGSYAFNGCKGLTNITIPKSVKTIGEYTFNNCSALNTVVIYGGADGIGNHIFSGCKSLADLTLPFAGLNEKTIDDPDTRNELSVLFLNGDDKDYYAIYNSGNWRRYIPKSLKKITVLSGTRLSDFAFYRFTGVESFVLPNSMTEIGNYSFADCSSITKNNIPEGVKYIDDHAFENCTSLSDGKIPEGVISIGNYAFSNCSSAVLKTITLPKTLTAIGNNAFSGCSGLTSVTVPETVKTIGAYAFSDCSSLASAVINGGADGIGYHVFSGCKSLAELILPFAGYSLEAANDDDSKQELLDLFLNGNDEDYYAIYNSGTWRRYIPKALKTITINGGKQIPKYAFFRMLGVENVYLPKGVTNIADNSFDGCSGIQNVFYPSTKADWEKNVTVGTNNEEIDGKVRFLNDKGVYDTTTSTTSSTTSTTSTTTSTTSKTTTSTTSKTTTSTTSTTTSTTSKTTTSTTSKTTSTTSKTTTSTTSKTTYTTSKTTTSTTSMTATTKNKTTATKTSPTEATKDKTTASTTSATTSTLISSSSTSSTSSSSSSSSTSSTSTSTTSTSTSTSTSTVTATMTQPVPPEPHRLDIQGDMTVTEMSKDDIIKAGINLNNKSNYHVFEYSVKLTFEGKRNVNIKKYKAVCTEDGSIVSVKPGYSDRDEQKQQEEQQEEYVLEPVITIDDEPVKVIDYRETEHEEMYMIISGECKWLKEFYDVKLIVINKDTENEALTNCSATLNVPDGLTLMNCPKTQLIAKLDAGDAYTVHWYVRGDKAGDYDLTADFKGKNRGKEFTYNFRSQNTLHVYAGNALKMKISLPRYSFFDEDYPVTISFENVSNKPIYNIEERINGYIQSVQKRKYKGDELISAEPTKTLNKEFYNDMSYSVGQLDPGEKVVVTVAIHDVWKSVIEKEIQDAKAAADIATLLSSSKSNQYLLAINLISTLGRATLEGIVPGHILKHVSVATLHNSTTTIPYEVEIIDVADDLKSKYTKSMLEEVAKSLLAFSLSEPGLESYSDLNNICIFMNDVIKNGTEIDKDLYPFVKFLTSIMDNGSIGNALDLGNDLYYRLYKPEGSAKVTFFIVRADGTIQYAPASNVKAPDRSAYEDFDIDVIDGEYTVAENGDMIFTSDALIKITPKKANIRATIGAVSDDGKESFNVPVVVVDEHECKGENVIIAPPSDGNGATSACFCETCGELLDCSYLPEEAVAMLSNGECYNDIRGAVADYKNYDEKDMKLYIFGNINIVEDVTVPEDIMLVIIPETKITVNDGCKLIAKGDVKDFSGYNYDLSGNGSISSIVTTTATTTTTTSTTTSATTTSATSTTSKTSSTTSTTVTTESTSATITTETNSGNSSNNYDELPQTGNNSITDTIIVFAAFMLVGIGAVAILAAYVMRRKENEE